MLPSAYSLNITFLNVDFCVYSPVPVMPFRWPKNGFRKKKIKRDQQHTHRFEIDLEAARTHFDHSISRKRRYSREASNRGPRTDPPDPLRTRLIEHLRHSSRSARPASDFSCFRSSAKIYFSCFVGAKIIFWLFSDLSCFVGAQIKGLLGKIKGCAAN